MVFHCFHRVVTRLPLCEREGNYLAPKKVLAQAHTRAPLRMPD
jgi:hypothetical protein